MQTFDQATDAVESYSPAEERFNRRRRTIGLWLAPAVLLVLLALPLAPALAAHRMAAILGLVVVLWMTEALPMAVTAMLGPVLAVIFSVADARGALAPFADPIIFLFIGSFILAEAMFVHGVDRRIAFTALSSPFVGSSALRVLVVYAAVATVISMWISNTATTAMMFPIGLSIVNHLMRVAPRDEASRHSVRQFALGLMLLTSFGASVGGMATPVGTPPNLIGIGMLDRIAHVRISFFQWMALGLPIVVLLFGFLVALFSSTARGLRVGEGSGDLVRDELRRLGPLSPAERNVLVAFGVTVVLWVAPGLFTIGGWEQTAFARGYARAMPEGIAAMVGAMLLFVLPVDWRARRFTITWDQAVRIDWGIVLLYGGGLAIGGLAFSTGLADALGRGITAWLPVAQQLCADRTVHGHGHHPLGSHVQHRLGQHDRAGRHRGGAGRGCAAGGACAGRHPRREHGFHDAHLHGSECHRLQLRLHSDHGHDALRHRTGYCRLRADRGGGHARRTDALLVDLDRRKR